jgi:hypothetical protein
VNFVRNGDDGTGRVMLAMAFRGMGKAEHAPAVPKNSCGTKHKTPTGCVANWRAGIRPRRNCLMLKFFRVGEQLATGGGDLASGEQPAPFMAPTGIPCAASS